MMSRWIVGMVAAGVSMVGVACSSGPEAAPRPDWAQDSVAYDPDAMHGIGLSRSDAGQYEEARSQAVIAAARQLVDGVRVVAEDAAQRFVGEVVIMGVEGEAGPEIVPAALAENVAMAAVERLLDDIDVDVWPDEPGTGEDRVYAHAELSNQLILDEIGLALARRFRPLIAAGADLPIMYVGDGTRAPAPWEVLLANFDEARGPSENRMIQALVYEAGMTDPRPTTE